MGPSDYMTNLGRATLPSMEAGTVAPGGAAPPIQPATLLQAAYQTNNNILEELQGCVGRLHELAERLGIPPRPEVDSKPRFDHPSGPGAINALNDNQLIILDALDRLRSIIVRFEQL